MLIAEAISQRQQYLLQQCTLRTILNSLLTNFLGNWKDIKTNVIANMFTTSTKTFYIMTVMDIQKPQIKSHLIIS